MVASTDVLGDRGLQLLRSHGALRQTVSAMRRGARRDSVRGAIATMGVGPHEALLDITLPSLQRYATAHGLHLHAIRRHIDDTRPVAWSKVAILRELLDRYDRVAWIDADAVIVDPRHDLTRQVGRIRPIGLVTHEYGGLTIPNMGVMALRSGPAAKLLLHRIWNRTQYIDHKWWENAALLDLLGFDLDEPRWESCRRTLVSSWTSHLIQPMDVAWNSIDLHRSPTPIIQHFPGLTNEVRVERLQAALDGR